MKKLAFLTTLFCLLFYACSWAEEKTLNFFSISPIRVIDGNTFVALDDKGREIKIRLFGIDCPEKNQPWGKEAAAMTENYLMQSETVVASMLGLDRYARCLCLVMTNYLGAVVPLNSILVAEGLAWKAPEYPQNKIDKTLIREFGSTFFLHQAKAQDEKKRIWNGKYKAVPPWEWRKGKR